MGLYHEPQIESYWHTAHPLKPLHPICNHMSLSHFEQIKHYLHILPPMSGPLNHKPTPKEEVREGQLESKWWHKLDPMISQFQSASEQYYIPGSKIAIDKVMIKTYGQSLHTFKMPNKPIPQGFKIYALADHGYIFTFTPASHTASLAEIVKSSDMTMTGSMVLELISHLPGLGYQYTLYLDNYFTSVGLFKLLCSWGVGSCETTQAHGKGFPPLIRAMKEWDLKLPWSTMIAIPYQDVLCFAWQDNNLVTGLTTVHTIGKTNDLIEQEWRWPAKTSTSAAITRPIFGSEATKKLTIPCVIDDYNHYMGAVDIANQLCLSYTSHHPTFCTWFLLFFWILDATVVNIYHLQCIMRQENGDSLSSQVEFWQALYMKIWSQYSTSLSPGSRKRKASHSFNLPACRLDHRKSHIQRQIPGGKRTWCVWCCYTISVQKNLGGFQI